MNQGNFSGAYRERSIFNPLRYLIGKYKKDKRMTAFVESRLFDPKKYEGNSNVVNVYRGKMTRKL